METEVRGMWNTYGGSLPKTSSQSKPWNLVYYRVHQGLRNTNAARILIYTFNIYAKGAGIVAKK